MSTETNDAEKLGSKRAFSGRMLKMDVDTVRLPNGVELDLEIVRHPGAAAVVPVDENGEVILVRQYRYVVDGWLLEIPAGKLDAPDEDPKRCAERELLEETGFRAERWTALGAIYVSPGFTDERISLYLAEGLTAGEQQLEADEVLDVQRVALEDAIAQAFSGDIPDAKSAVALMRAHQVLRAR
ncbi:MAG: NUDIX hydrolase [Myxococcota bacterium]